MSIGVIYIVTGERCIREALQSAASLKDKMPDILITIFSDKEIKSNLFDNIVLIKPSQIHKQFLPDLKVYYISQSPYEKTLYLDSDTYVCDDISELFSLLDRFDIAAAHAPQRWESWCKAITGVPACFPELNCGVILFKKSSQVDGFLNQWLTLFKKNLNSEHLTDQQIFRKVLYNSTLRIATLAPEYNCRFIQPGFVNKTVKILHGRHFNLPALAADINASTEPRTHRMGNWGKIEIIGYRHGPHNLKRMIRIREYLSRFLTMSKLPGK